MEADGPRAEVQHWFNVWSNERDGQLYRPPKWHPADDAYVKSLARRLIRKRFSAKISVAAVLIYIHEWNDRGLPQWNIDHFNSFFSLESAAELRLLKKATAELPVVIQAAKTNWVRMSSPMNAAVIRISSDFFFSLLLRYQVDFSIMS
jgi:hypothetical protein